MKKLLSVILCLSVCLAVFAGCKNTQEPEPEQVQAPESTQGLTPSPTPTIAPVVMPSTTPVTSPVAMPVSDRFPFTEENFPRIDGSTATIPLIEAVTSALLGKPRADINVSVSKTSEAYVALAKNETDILLVYDSGDETREQVNADTLFETVPIGKDALVFLVNRDNPVENLTTEQVRKIFSGEYTNWREVGGSNEPIKAYQRGIGSGSQALMDKLVMPGLTMANPAMIPVIGEMGVLVDVIADFAGGPLGIGYNVFYYVTEMRGNDYIKILPIDGIEPNYDTIQSGEYPFVSDFYSVIRKDEPAESPARALHEWMQTDEAQNLIAGEGYVALHANPAAGTPYVDGRFSIYPDGEVPLYFGGVDPYTFEPRGDYGQLYFYLGAVYNYGLEWEYYVAPLYGLCTAGGKIVTEPIYSIPLLLTDSKGNKAYFCYRSHRAPVKDMVVYRDFSYEVDRYPALLFAMDGSWIREFEAAVPFRGMSGPVDDIMNADILAVMQNGKWGAVNIKGETVLPFNKNSSEGIYPLPDGGIGAFAVTGDRFMLNIGMDASGGWLMDLYDGNGNRIASGLRGRPEGMSGDFIVANEWGGEAGLTVYTYTLDGELIASVNLLNQGGYGNACPFGDYVMIYAADVIIVFDRELNTLYEFQHRSHAYYPLGPNVLYDSDRDRFFHRTYLPDGTRLVTWYDPDMA